jgi:hypothetical protein
LEESRLLLLLKLCVWPAENEEAPVEWGERWLEDEEAAEECELIRGAGGLKSASNANAGAGGARSIRDSGKFAS